MLDSQMHRRGQLSDTIEWRFEVLNQHCIFITFIEYGEVAKIEPRWINIIEQCLKTLQKKLPIRDSVSAYITLLVELEQPINDRSQALIENALSSINLNDEERPEVEKLVLPVFYDESVGKDLAFISQEKNITIDEVIRLHSEVEYQVYAVGFSPGFAFMGELNTALQLPRRSTPRQLVPKGSVAIAENQTAIYPNDSPGGWHILGNCPLSLFNPEKSSPNVFEVGQRVTFQSISLLEFQALLKDRQANQLECSVEVLAGAGIKILKSSALSLVIDKGRQSAQHNGLTQSGPMDSHAFFWANHLLGNHVNAPMIEVSMGGLSLAAECNTIFSLTGANLSAEIERVDGSRKQLTPWMSYALLKDERLHVHYFKQQGLRAYVAFQGGFEFSHKPLFNSYSAVVRENLGGHKGNGSPLDKGDKLKINPVDKFDKPRPYLMATPYRYRNIINNKERMVLMIRLAYQAELFSEAAIEHFLNQTYEVSSLIDRMAYRFNALEKIPVPDQGIASEGIAVGSVQITPDGEPIVLMRDRQTIGGYPKIAVLTEESVNDLSQASPGQKIRFSLQAK